MLIKIMLTAWIFFVLSLLAAKFQKDTTNDVGYFTAWVCVGCLVVFLLSGAAVLLGMIWL